MKPDPRQVSAAAMLGLVMMLWAGNSMIGRVLRDDIGPFALAFLRWAGASLLLMPFAVTPLRRDWPAIRRGWKPLVLLGLLGVAGYNTLLYTGLRHTTASNALLLQAAMPGLVILFDRILFGVRSRIQQILGVICSAGGAVVIAFKGDWTSFLVIQSGRGEGFVILAIVAWALYTVLLRLKPGISAISMLACTFVVGVIALAPLAAWEAYAGEAIRWSGRLGLALVYVSLFASLIAFFLYNRAAAAIGPVRAGQALNLLPLFGALLSAGLLREPLLAFHFAGMALILAGTAAVALTGSAEDGANNRADGLAGRS